MAPSGRRHFEHRAANKGSSAKGEEEGGEGGGEGHDNVHVRDDEQREVNAG